MLPKGRGRSISGLIAQAKENELQAGTSYLTMAFYTNKIVMYEKEWKTNDIIGYLQSDDYKNLSQGVHGKATVTAQTKFAWFPVRLRSKKFLWLKEYIERRLKYLNVRGKERLSKQEYMLERIKDTV